MENTYSSQMKLATTLAEITEGIVLTLHLNNAIPMEKAIEAVHHSRCYANLIEIDNDLWHTPILQLYTEICETIGLEPVEVLDSLVCDEMDEVDFALKVFEKTRVLLGDSGVILQRILDVNGFYPLLFEKFREEPGTDPESVAQKLASEFEKKYYRQHPDWPRMSWFRNN